MSDAERIAYLAARAPATGAAVRAVLRELQARGLGLIGGSSAPTGQTLPGQVAASNTAASAAEAREDSVGARFANAAGTGGAEGGEALASAATAEEMVLREAVGIEEVADEAIGAGGSGGKSGTWAGWAEGATAVRTLLDLGAGPGIGVWAALDRFSMLEAATLVERDAGSIALGQQLAGDAGLDARLPMTWRCADLREPLDTLGLAPHDLVLLSYSIGELDDAPALALLDAAWHLARQALVIVEPGTPRHFARLLALRQRLIDRGGRILAPCPHARACPMAPPDWCHFAARLGRTRVHRQLKGGALSYEDEKYCYIAVVRETLTPPSMPASESTPDPATASGAVPAAASGLTPAPVLTQAVTATPARIVRRPEFHKGFVRLPLCATDGLRVETVTKSRRDRYRAARDASWGDAWEEPCPGRNEE